MQKFPPGGGGVEGGMSYRPRFACIWTTPFTCIWTPPPPPLSIFLDLPLKPGTREHHTRVTQLCRSLGGHSRLLDHGMSTSRWWDVHITRPTGEGFTQILGRDCRQVGRMIAPCRERSQVGKRSKLHSTLDAKTTHPNWQRGLDSPNTHVQKANT